MKLTVFLLLLSVISVFASKSYSQTKELNLNLKNSTVKEVLQNIEEQSEFVFMYSEKLVDVTREVSVNIKNQKINEVLDELFAGTDVNYKVRDRFILLITPEVTETDLMAQQQRRVSGTVTDESGQPLPGVTVVVKGTTQGTVTNADGEYTLTNIQEDAILQFSFVGMRTQEIEVGGQTSINVTMEQETIGLGEVVAIGYGSRSREALTGSISEVESQSLDLNPVGNITQALQGSTAGVQVSTSNMPGKEAKIRIRGLGTINNNNPLWVIDGVFATSGLNRISSAEIESITVLKDAASTAIYGARGANGVILVTTTQGKKSQAPRVNLDVRHGTMVNSAKYEMLNPTEFGEMLWLMFKNSGVEPSHPQYGSGPTPQIPEYILPAGASEADISRYDRRDYPITKADAEGTDWVDELLNAGITKDYNLSVTGGSENSTYGITMGYLDEEGMLIKSGFDRYTFRANSAINVNKWLEIGENIGISNVNHKGYASEGGWQTPFNEAMKIQQMMPIKDEMGNWSAPTRVVGFDANYHPVARQHYRENATNKILGIIGNIYSKINLMDGLSFKTMLGINFRDSRSRTALPVNPESYVARTKAELSEGSSVTRSWNWTNTLNYLKTINDDHTFDLLLGTEALTSNYRSLSASRKGFFLEEDNYMILNAGESDQQNSGSVSENATMSYFGRLHYEYLNKYMLDFTSRYDGSSRFGAENRWGFFPSAAVGWLIYKENFMSGTENYLDQLKIRLSLGQSGNDQIGSYNGFSTFQSHDTYSYYPIDGSNSSLTPGIESKAYGNPDAKWESTTTVNLGLSTILFKLFAVEFDIWRRKTEDMLYPKQIPDVYGQAAVPSINIGTMENNGFDLILNYSGNGLQNEFSYNLTANISHYKNEIIKLSDVQGESIQGGSTRAEEGTAFPEFYGYKVLGILQTQEEADSHPDFEQSFNKPGRFKYADINDDGVLDDEDRTYIGSPHPDLTVGFNVDLRYKNFDLMGFFNSSIGNEIANTDRAMLDFNVREFNRSSRRLYESWGSPYLENNEDAKMPMAELNDSQERAASSYFIEDGSYLRLESVQVGYSLPKHILDKISMENVRLYVMGTNLFTLTGYSGLDPEVQTGDRNFGVASFHWPSPHRYMFGVNVSF